MVAIVAVVRFGEVVRRSLVVLGVDDGWGDAETVDDADDDDNGDEVASPQWGETDVRLV